MGWRGTIRSINASVKRAEREAQRRHKQGLKEQMIDDAAAAVADWEDYVDQLVSIHVDLANAVDWHAMQRQPRPQLQSARISHTDLAK